MDPPPSAGEGARRSRAGEGNHTSGEVAIVVMGAHWINVALPLSAGLRPAALTAFATLPRRGGRVLGGVLVYFLRGGGGGAGGSSPPSSGSPPPMVDLRAKATSGLATSTNSALVRPSFGS